MAAIPRISNLFPNTKTSSSSSLVLLFSRSFSLWSMKKDPALESALSRNRRWIVNNQLKNIILRCPDQIAPVRFIQKKFKTLDLQGKALNWFKKYPCCFETYLKDDEYYCKLTKRMMSLVEEEENVKYGMESILVDKLAKLLMMSSNRRLNVIKFNELKRNFGFPDDYLVWILPKYPEMFRIVNRGSGRRSMMEIELVSWQPHLATSSIEILAHEKNTEPHFECCLPLSWTKSQERFLEFNKAPYISPYSDARGLEEGSMEMEKRVIGVVHELLSLTLWKKASIIKLGHFRREFGFPEKLNVLLLRHPGIFYVSNKYQIYTVVLREGYCGSELIDKDPLVVVKDKFGELMQEGLHEYNRRRHVVNLEKKKKRGLVVMKLERKNGRTISEMSEHDDDGEERGEIYNPEERKRFYRSLFDESDP
ncbi:protein WHAT'S THIS FACTOR 1 homolog, chloroplastic [Magnolia sinica]|uniref:protein WHAT'S THIS FACTOR 1 homolog, chloroplastic n=1 Tax=Magnolia sinica TaxID=86752 RepID=UPI00265B500D|nr:protein WHAT'S THIS FACTOR 1 homolog, chloroplastic [Magnolia sinica]